MRIQLRHVAAVAIILVEILAVVWMFPYLPMTDLPEHMLAAKILTHYEDTELSYALYFTKRIPWNPYASYFLFVLATEPALGVRNATRMYVSLAFILTIVSFWYWIRAVVPGQDAQVIPGTLLLFGAFFYIGLVNFLFSAPFLLFSLALGWKILSDDQLRMKHSVLLGLCLLITYLSHAATFGLACLMLFLQAVFVFKGRRMTRLVLPAAPALILLVFYLLTEGQHNLEGFTYLYDPLSLRLSTLLMPLNMFLDPITGDWTNDRATLILWLMVLSLSAIGVIFGKYKVGRVTPRIAWGMFFMFVAGVLLLPSWLSNGQALAFRYSYFAAFAFVALLPTAWDSNVWTRWLMIAGCAALPIVIAIRMAGFTVEMKELENVIAQMPPQKVIQPIITEPHSAAFRGEYSFLHAAAWYSFYKGGVSPYLTASWATHFPVRTRQQFIPHPAGEWQMNTFRYETNQEGTDYFLVRTLDEKIVADLKKHVPLAISGNSWLVFGPNR